MDDVEENSKLMVASTTDGSSRGEFSKDMSLSNVIRTEMKLTRNGHLPDIKMYLSLSLKPSDVIILFLSTAASNSFFEVDKCKVAATVEYKPRLNIKNILQ